jgi:Protein of unknown function (DUF1553)/Protein of unknown function (DUF1549)/Planctomycete cytochrome C
MLRRAFVKRYVRWMSCAITMLAPGATAHADAPPAEFFRGVNLNGPPLVIDGRKWEGDDSKYVETRDRTFENQDVALIPPTDPERARMIRSSRWNGQIDMKVTAIPPGTYSVFLYVWEDNNSETFSISLDGREVLHDYVSGPAGTWKKLGPWGVVVATGAIRVTTDGGAANISGVEIWKGDGPFPAPAGTETHPIEPRDPNAARLFDAEIAPILAKHCLECHGRSIQKAKLALSSEVAALAGGQSGPVIVPGKPDESVLWEYVEAGEMPRDRPPLSAAEKQRIKRWIADGAKWGASEIDPFLATTERRAGYDWWSLQAVRKPSPPAVRDSGWMRNGIDGFVMARLEAANLRPAPEADRRTLIRRLTFDLTGLPPDPGDVERFVADPDEKAYELLIDRLLASPEYGERWARHWLDVVRFGESQGFERNHVRDNAWRYRDWVISAFNRDLPYDEFVRQQIAGDVLHPNDLEALIATGYHVCGTWDQVAHREGSSEMQKATRFDELEDLVSTLGQTFLGLTINCARCHDHKFDPISQKEYYQVAALLAGVNQEEMERSKIPLSATRDQPGFSGVGHVIIAQQPPPLAVLERGDYRKRGEVVSPAGIKALTGLSPNFGLSPDAPEARRREALARWLTDPHNPLTARVFVNRLWYHHFGQGLVESPSDFGYNGGRPSHPELLDYLAARFMDGGWKVKDLHRLIVNSAAYRQESRVHADRAESVDADNRLLWRANRRRLEGEALRDAALAVSGSLNRRVGGPSFEDVKLNRKGANTNHEFTDPTGEFSDAVNRRTIYRLWARSGSHPMLETLDCPDPSVMAPRRTRTITPIQALSLSNNAFMEKCADKFAGRVRVEAGDDVARQVARAWLLAFARSPTERERRVAQSFAERRGLEQFCLALFNTNEFMFID